MHIALQNIAFSADYRAHIADRIYLYYILK